MTNQRRHPRFVCDLQAQVTSSGGASGQAKAADISRGGICLWIARAFPVGSEIDLSLTLVLAHNAFSEPLELRASVIWCTPVESEHQLGCKFVALTSQQ